MKPTVIHMTDLYHPHNDPDDHWNVAMEFALHYKGDINLAGICFDGKHPDYGDPAIGAVAQMNYIVNDAVPMGIGLAEPLKDETNFRKILKQPPNGAVKLILNTLETSREPVYIHVCGSCRDIAVAGALRPDLFKRNCGGIYLNAGSSKPMTRLDWNVWLEPYAYIQIFKIPCKIYWMPCLNVMPEFEESSDSSFFNMPQKEVLPYLSDNVKKYFLYMFDKVEKESYLEYLLKPLDKERLEHFAVQDRQMYCPAGFFHAAGYGVNTEGQLLPKNDPRSVFRFVPVEPDIDSDAMLRSYKICSKSNIYLLEHSMSVYAPAMTKAMKELLSLLP
jgi:hypothetical protein